MIEVINDKERNLKNVKQIGTPRDDDKIYLENQVYWDIKNEPYREKNVFVLMGHTERMGGRYATFVESVIHVKDMEFSGNTPRWDNRTWSEVFHVIKQSYDDMIIVGWAVDIRGMSPRLSPELERAHREHFGGVHQLLFLLDTLEQEENFYVYKENKLVEKDGFYIYHQARKKEKMETIPIKVLPEKNKNVKEFSKINTYSPKEPRVDVEVDIVDGDVRRGGKYRQLMQEQQKPKAADEGNLGIAIAVAMLIFVIGIGFFENGDLFARSDSVETNLLNEAEDDTSTQTTVDAVENLEDTDENAVIPVEEVTEEKE